METTKNNNSRKVEDKSNSAGTNGYNRFLNWEINMDMTKLNSILDNIRETERSMRVTVKIPREEEDRIVINALIRIRNSNISEQNNMAHFDKVIKHYLSEEEFVKYVINKHQIEF